MPVISKTDYPFEHGSFKKVVKVSANGEFSCALPDPVATLLGKTEVVGQTRQAVDGAFSEALAQYKNAQTTSKKVICYQISLAGYVLRDAPFPMARSVTIIPRLKAPCRVASGPAAAATNWPGAVGKRLRAAWIGRPPAKNFSSSSAPPWKISSWNSPNSTPSRRFSKSPTPANC